MSDDKKSDYQSLPPALVWQSIAATISIGLMCYGATTAFQVLGLISLFFCIKAMVRSWLLPAIEKAMESD